MPVRENEEDKNEFEESDVEDLKQIQMKEALAEMKRDIMMDSEGSTLAFEDGW